MKPKFMDPTVYRGLEFAAEQRGGIGACDDTEYVCRQGYVPFCVWGYGREVPKLYNELSYLGIGRLDNDVAVSEINEAIGEVEQCARVSFRRWARKLRVYPNTRMGRILAFLNL